MNIQAPPRHDRALLMTARGRATEMRAAWALAVHRGDVTIQETVTHATTEEGRALLALGLVRLLAAQPTWSRARADRAIVHIHETLKLPLPDRRDRSMLTVKWLIDGRTAGRRLLALADFQARDARPYSGFPYAPLPAGVTHAISTETTRRGTTNVRSTS